MRTLLLLAACSLLTAPLACTHKKIIVQKATTETEATDEDNDEDEDEEPPPKPAGDPLVIDLGEVQAGTDVTFDIPEGALGFNITAEGKMSDFSPNRPFGIERIVDPSGKDVHADFTPNGGSHETSYAAFDVIASVSVPQGNTAPKSLAGTWKVRFGVFGGTAKPKLKGKVRVQWSGDGAFHGGTLDLHVHVPPGLEIAGRSVDPEKAASNTALRTRLDTFFSLTSDLLGIERGEVVFHTAPSRFADLDGMQEVLDGFAVSKGQKDGTQALHMLITNSISDDGEPFAAGIAPGIPGAPTVFGRNVSGIIVTPSAYADQDALTMLHEAGHFFGLNHTSEFSGDLFDPLEDTPECPALGRQDYYSCGDRWNIMFPAGPIAGPPTLSPKQVRVFQGSPIYKANTAPGATRPMAGRAAPVWNLERRFRLSGGTSLSPVERELSLGFCGLTPIDADGIARRHGRAEAIQQLETAAADADLVPFVRGRARLALKQLATR